MSTNPTPPPSTNSANGRPAWHALPPEFASARLESSAEHGLTAAEAARRLQIYGPNSRAADTPPGRQVGLTGSLQQLRRPANLLLLALAGLLLAIQLFAPGLLVFAAALLQIGLGAYFQQRTLQTQYELDQLARPPAVVRRDGTRRTIPAEEVVPGDLILLEHGRIVPAEARLLTATSLQVCLPEASTRRARLDKTTDAVLTADAPVVERSTMVHPGMLVCRGLGSALVVSTGDQAVRLSQLEDRAGSQAAPTRMQQEYHRQARWMAVLAIGASLLLPGIGWWRGYLSELEAIASGLALAFALLPLDGPWITGFHLALGAESLARRLARARSLQAVESLGAVSTVLSSKTGLLTDGKLQVQRSVPAAWSRQLMEIALMTTILDFEGDGATLDGPPGLEGGVLDKPPAPVSSNAGPLDAALLQAAHQAGLDVAALRANRPVEACYQLDPLRRRMSVIYRRGVRLWISVKGAPEAVLETCTRRWTADGVDHLTEVDRQAIVETAAVLAEGGGRVIALAERAVPPEEARRPFTPASVERDLNFAGLLALTDRIRPESSLAVQQCQRAGIQVLLVTGDHPVAARAAGLQSGLTVADKPVLTGPELAGKPPAELLAAVHQQRVLAQTNPLLKLQVVQALQSGGACVAATGSYPMEAPVLAAADVGVARQEGASDAARLAADLVLLDGRFSALVRAIARGRLIYANLSKTLSLYLAAKLGLLMAITLPVLLGVPLPLSVPQLVLAGLGLATALPLVYPREAAEHALMRRPPPDRRRAPFTPLMIARLLRGAFGLFVVVTISYFGSLLGFGDLPRARMLAFCTWMIMLVLLAYSLRSDTGGLLSQNPFSNRALFSWATLVVVLVVGFAAWPVAAALLGGGALTAFEWVLCLLALLVGLVFVEVRKWVASRGLGR